MVAAAIQLAPTPLSSLRLARIVSGQQLWGKSTTDISTSFATLNLNLTENVNPATSTQADLHVAIWLLALRRL